MRTIKRNSGGRFQEKTCWRHLLKREAHTQLRGTYDGRPWTEIVGTVRAERRQGAVVGHYAEQFRSRHRSRRRPSSVTEGETKPALRGGRSGAVNRHPEGSGQHPLPTMRKQRRNRAGLRRQRTRHPVWARRSQALDRGRRLCSRRKGRVSLLGAYAHRAPARVAGVKEIMRLRHCPERPRR